MHTLLEAGFPERSYFKGIFNGFRFRHHFDFVRVHRGYSIDVVDVVVVDFESVPSSDQAILLEHRILSMSASVVSARTRQQVPREQVPLESFLRLSRK